MHQDLRYYLTNQNSLYAGIAPNHPISKRNNTFFRSLNILLVDCQQYIINHEAVSIDPHPIFIHPETFGISTGTIFKLPETIISSPDTIINSPGIIISSPETIFKLPGKIMKSPGTFGMFPGTRFIDPQTLFIHPETAGMNDCSVLLRNNAYPTGPGGVIFVRTLFPKRRRAFPVGRALFGTLNKALQQRRKDVCIN